MGLLSDIQNSLLSGADLGPVLLKLRYLAARLGSNDLAEWVKHESEGYPPNTIVPDYRKFGVRYTASFNGPYGKMANDMDVPPALIAAHASEAWLTHEERQNVSAVEALIASSGKAGTDLHIDASDLIMLLGGKVFQGMACHGATGHISRASLVEMIATLRARVLDLTLELEQRVPVSREIEAGQAAKGPEKDGAATVTHITNQTIYGGVGTNVANSGAGAQFAITVSQGNRDSVAESLTDAGITQDDAVDFANIIASEAPSSRTDPLGPKAKKWIGEKVGKALDGTWKGGLAVATAVLTEAAKRYYGLS